MNIFSLDLQISYEKNPLIYIERWEVSTWFYLQSEAQIL